MTDTHASPLIAGSTWQLTPFLAVYFAAKKILCSHLGSLADFGSLFCSEDFSLQLNGKLKQYLCAVNVIFDSFMTYTSFRKFLTGASTFV